jgi:hypothetical protein
VAERQRLRLSAGSKATGKRKTGIRAMQRTVREKNVYRSQTENDILSTGIIRTELKNTSMVRQELYNKTVDILYQAYFNGTLKHVNCYACAVGNIIAANSGYSFIPCKSPLFSSHSIVWDITGGEYAVEGKNFAPWFGAIKKIKHSGTAEQQIKSTGYDINQLALIEDAFESAPAGNNDEDHMFNGLVAVLKVLDEIHQVDQTISEQNKSRFSHHYETLLPCSK